MSEKYSTIQQHQPLRVPASFDKQARALVVQLDEIFDDVYRRFGRLRMEDMGKEFKNRIEDDEGNISDLSVDFQGITGRVSDAEGEISALEIRAGNIELSVQGKYDKQSSIEIEQNGIELSGGKYIKMKTGSTTNVLLDNNGIDMQTAGKAVIHAADASNSSIVFGSDQANANFAVGVSGDVLAKSISTGSLTVGGNPFPNIVVSDSQPSGHNLVWLKPSGSGSGQEKQWSYVPSNKTFPSTGGGTLGYYQDMDIPYSASDYLSGNLYYGIRIRVYAYNMPTLTNVTIRASVKNGNSWIVIGSATGDVYTSGVVVIDTFTPSTNANVMSASGGYITLRIECSRSSNEMCMLNEGLVLKARESTSSGVQECTTYYIS